MTQLVNIDAYFSRTGYTGGREATLEHLLTIILRHTQAIAFENLTPLAQLPVRLDIDSLQQKIIHEQRGGYCFEQNLLLWQVLRQLGFTVSGLAARVMWNAPDAISTRSHMLLLVQLDGESHVVDVAFGGLTLTGVLRLTADVEQATPLEPFRLLHENDEWVMQARIHEQWRPLYRFDLQPQLPNDYEPINWYLSTHPQSRFVNNLIAARSTPDRRHTLFNRELTVHPLNGETQRRTLLSVDELRQALSDIFLIRVPESEPMDRALGKVLGL